MNRSLPAVLGYIGVAAVIVGFFLIVPKIPGVGGDHGKMMHIVKGGLAIAAVCALFYEQFRERLRKPISERWKKAVGISLGVIAVAMYFNGFKVGYKEWYHLHDQFHYYVGAKYFPELGYDNLYKCSAVAQDDLGVVMTPEGYEVNFRTEVRRPQRKLRDIGATNLLIPAKEILENPGLCKDAFTPERWEMFKEDIKFFRQESGRGYWEGMQKDHGYNPPPIWTLAGRAFAELGPASVRMQQFIGALDVGYLVLMFIGLYWAFGYRVFAAAAILWGCEAAGDPYFWTGGAFLRQDWMFFVVMAMCLARKRYFKLAGAAMVYAGLLRIFPGVMVIGWLGVAGWYLARHKRMHPDHLQALIGGTAAAAVLLGASLIWVGAPAWKSFYHHTIEVHDRTPLTNHMGLRVVVAHNFIGQEESGRMRYTRDNSLVDPFQVWKEKRVERYENYKPVAYGIRLAFLAAFIYILRRVKSLWVAQGLAVIFVILFAQLTNYYYSFMICAAPLIKVRKQLELVICGYVVLTQVIFAKWTWNDDKYALQTILGILFCMVCFALFWPPKKTIKKVVDKLKRAPAT